MRLRGQYRIATMLDSSHSQRQFYCNQGSVGAPQNPNNGLLRSYFRWMTSRLR